MTIGNPCDIARPFYHYRVDTGSYHLSHLDDAGYRDLGEKTTKGKHKLQPGRPKDFTKLPVVKRFTTAPHVSHRDGQMPVELLGPVICCRSRAWDSMADDDHGLFASLKHPRTHARGSEDVPWSVGAHTGAAFVQDGRHCQ